MNPGKEQGSPAPGSCRANQHKTGDGAGFSGARIMPVQTTGLTFAALPELPNTLQLPRYDPKSTLGASFEPGSAAKYPVFFWNPPMLAHTLFGKTEIVLL